MSTPGPWVTHAPKVVLGPNIWRALCGRFVQNPKLITERPKCRTCLSLLERAALRAELQRGAP